jgi:hypothetical protein
MIETHSPNSWSPIPQGPSWSPSFPPIHVVPPTAAEWPPTIEGQGSMQWPLKPSHRGDVPRDQAEIHGRDPAQELFAPLPYLQSLPSSTGAETVDYANLLGQDSVLYAARPPKVDTFGNVEQQWRPTAETRAAALDRLRIAAQADVDLSRILNEESAGLGLTDQMQTVDALRLVPDFRLRIGTYLRSKIDRYADAGWMPDRISKNDEKADVVDGYPIRKMRSRDYATLVALSMIDGTFNQERIGPAGQVEINEDSVQGQHRLGALRVLGLAQSTVASARYARTRL